MCGINVVYLLSPTLIHIIMKNIRKLNKIVKKVFKNETFEIETSQFSGTVRISGLSYNDDKLIYDNDGDIFFCTVNIEIVDIKKNIWSGRRYWSPQLMSRRRNESIRRYFNFNSDENGLIPLMKLVGIQNCTIGKITYKK